jgi:uncharacterized protein YjbI with pentapeptide repeats
MAREEHVEILRQSVEHWNAWRLAHPDVRPDWRGADLRQLDLRGTHLSQPTRKRSWVENLGAQRRALLTKQPGELGIDLRQANLHGARLPGAFLSGWTP